MEQTQAPNLATSTAKLSPSNGVVKFLKDCTAGTVGGIAVVGVGHPFGMSLVTTCSMPSVTVINIDCCCMYVDTIKVRLQTQSATNPVYSGAFDCLKKTLQWEGVGGLYKVCRMAFVLDDTILL